MSQRSQASPPSAIFEEAGEGRRWLGWLLWLIPLAAVGLSVGFAWLGVRDQGPIVVLHADHGHGIDAGDAVRYLGIEVGEVRSVGVGEGTDQQLVKIELQLRSDAAALARAGTNFWIVRPQLTLDSVQGVDTIIGARYIALDPGPAGSQRKLEFTALMTPPLPEEVGVSGALEIVMEAPTRFGLQPGAGITYRGVRIGSVVAVGLASDATAVEVTAKIRPAYAQLVRERSVFWETGGFEFGLSLTEGLEVDLDSLRTALIGGIAMATPVDAGGAVAAGTRFPLFADVEDEWLDWAPALPLGNDLLPAGTVMPKLLRASLSWEEGRVLRSDKERSGWMLVDAQGLVAPSDLLAVPEDARDDRATLQVAGRSLDVRALLSKSPIQRGEEAVGDPALARLLPAAFSSGWDELRDAHPGAQAQARRSLAEPEDLLIVRSGGRDPLGVDASRLRPSEGGMLIDDRIALRAAWHGAVCMARSDGAIVGVLLVDSDGAGRVTAHP